MPACTEFMDAAGKGVLRGQDLIAIWPGSLVQTGVKSAREKTDHPAIFDPVMEFDRPFGCFNCTVWRYITRKPGHVASEKSVRGHEVELIY